MIQSFAPGEVTPGQAMQIGEELCDRYLKGDYQYVIAVHNDKDHLHCHIIFNNTNLYNGLSFTTEHNQGRKSERAWAELREISDEICAEHGISVIEPIGKGVSHYENEMQKEGNSWKEKLRAKIAEVAIYSKSFEDFLQRCTECGIEYVYKPQNKYKLKFKLSGDGQQRFTRADTLGADFTPERITEQIAEIQEKLSAANVTPDMLIEPPKPVAVPKSEPKPTQTVTVPTTPPSEPGHLITNLIRSKMREKGISQAPKSTPTITPPTTPKPDTDKTVITAEEFLAPLYDKPAPETTKSKAPEKKNEDPWDLVRGMRDSDKMIAELEAVGITSFTEFTGFMYRGQHDDDHTDEVAELKTHIKTVETIIAKMKHHDDLVPTYREYKGLSGFKQSRYRKKHSEEIEDYEQTRAFLKKQPSLKDMEKLLQRMKDRHDEILPEHRAYLAKKQVAKQYTQTVRRYRDQQINKRAAEQSRQKKLTQQRKKYTLE